MKSAAVALVALASVAIAQPHGHARRHLHDKRDLVVEWVTEVETVTVEVDETTTQTYFPTQTEVAAAPIATASESGGAFIQAEAASTSSTYSAAAPSTTLIALPSTQQTSSEAAPTTSSSTSSSIYSTSTSTSETPIVVVPTVALPTTTAAAETSTYAAEPSSTTTAAASSGSGSSSGANVKNSDMTYYAIGLGSCGFDDAGLDMTKPVVAVDYHLWDSVSTATSYGVDQPAHPFCNQEITITYNGKTTTGIVRDRCGGCVENAIDVAEGLFDDLVGGTTAGRVDVEWYFNSGEW